MLIRDRTMDRYMGSKEATWDRVFPGKIRSSPIPYHQGSIWDQNQVHMAEQEALEERAILRSALRCSSKTLRRLLDDLHQPPYTTAVKNPITEKRRAVRTTLQPPIDRVAWGVFGPGPASSNRGEMRKVDITLIIGRCR